MEHERPGVATQYRLRPACSNTDAASRAGLARLVCSVLGVFLLAGGPVSDARGANWYTVELIVFERIGDANLDDEVWLADPGRPPIDESVTLASDAELALAEESGGEGAGSPFAFRLLDRSHFRLEGVFSRLRGSHDFRPLLHVGWHQPGYSRKRAKHAHIRGFRNSAGGTGVYSPGPGAWPVVDGTVQLYARRFLHLRADLLYYRRDPRTDLELAALGEVLPPGPAQGETEEAERDPGGASAAGTGDGAQVSVSALPAGSTLGADAAAELRLSADSERESESSAAGEHRGVARDGPPPVFRMTTSRRMRPGQLHYLDHPVFGVLVMVSRYAR